jgi:GH18 family chitinase
MGSSINPSLCTHIIYGFFSLTTNGGISADGDPSRFLALKNSYPNIKLLISFGSNYQIFENVSSNPTATNNFVNNALNYIQSNGLHGGEKMFFLFNYF